MAAKKCPMCGQTTLVTKNGDYRIEPPPNIPGGVIVIRDASWLHCDSCLDDILSSTLEAAIDRERYRRLGLLTPMEIRRIREKTGLSAVDLSRLLGVGEKTYTRWENGRSLQTKASDTLIRLIDQNAEMFALLDAERKPGRDELVCRYVGELEDSKPPATRPSTGIEASPIVEDGEYPKGTNRLGMAAHGADMSPEALEAVLKCLSSLRRDRAS